MELTSQEQQALESRCKHGMKWEYCGLCQRYTYQDDYTIYLEKKVDGATLLRDNGKPVLMKITGERTVVEYMRYR